MLGSAGFRTMTAENAEEALRDLRDLNPDLIIMTDDWCGGRELCSRIRCLSQIPIIVLGHSDELGRAAMLHLGADVYLVEPIGQSELVARVWALLRRYSKGQSNLEDLILDSHTNHVEFRGRAVDLTPTEFRLLSFLVQNSGRIIPFSALISKASGEKLSLDALHCHMRRLKQKLGIDLPYAPCRLINYRGEGYCLLIASESGLVHNALGPRQRIVGG